MFVMKITNNTLLNKLKLKTMKIINLVLNKFYGVRIKNN